MRTWLITGCSEGGIGAGIAKAVLAHGDCAVVTARSTAKVESIVREYPETSLAVALDVTRQESIDAAVAAARERFGQIDVLVNNAGYCYRSSVEEADRAGVDLMYETNLFGPKMGIVYGTGVYQRGEIKGNPAFAEAYEMGKAV